MTAASRRSPAWSWAVGLVCGAALVSLAIGIVRLSGTFESAFEGGYSTSAVGAPAYAAVFVMEPPSPHWFLVGTVLFVLAGSAVVWALTRRTRRRRVARAGAAGLVVALFVLAVGVSAMPRHMPRFGDEPKGFPDVPFHIPGRTWLVVGTALAFAGSGGLVRRALEPARRA